MLDKKNITITSTVIGILSLIFTLVLFFLIADSPSSANYLGLGFLILSEIALTAAVVFSFGSNKQNGKLLVKSGVVTMCAIFFLVSAALCVFSSAFTENFKTLLILEIIALFATVVVSIILIVASAHFSNIDTKTKQKLESGEYDKPKRGGF